LPVFRLTRCILVQAGQAIASYSFSETSGSSSNRCWTLKPLAGHLKTKFAIIQHQLGRQRCKKKPRGRAGLVRWRSSLGGANTDQCKLQGGPSGFVISGSGYPPSFSKQALSRNLLDRSLIVFRVFGAIRMFQRLLRLSLSCSHREIDNQRWWQGPMFRGDVAGNSHPTKQIGQAHHEQRENRRGLTTRLRQTRNLTPNFPFPRRGPVAPLTMPHMKRRQHQSST
jgi:hypothetical protein